MMKKALALMFVLLEFLYGTTSTDEKQLSIYSSVATYALPVRERGGHEYVGLLELLEPLGRVSSDLRGGRWRIRYNSTDGEFVPGRIRARVHGREFDLSAPFLMENSRGMVPLAALGSLLPRFLETRVTFHESARRLFVGDVSIQPSFHLESGPQPRLILNFSTPVNPTISTEPGKLRMVFKRDAIVSPGEQMTSFQSPVITQASYSEANGLAELNVSASIPLIATFSNNAKTITLSGAPSVAVAANPKPAAANNLAQSTQQPPAVAANAPSSSRILAIVDSAHGGADRGASLTDNLAEKDVTLGFGRLLRHELEVRGFAVVLLRDADNTLPLDQRASAANGARGAVYISLHAVSQGRGAHVYTSLLPVEDVGKGNFRAWNCAQAPALPLSQAVASAIVAELQKKQFPVGESSASLRPLNNLIMPAVAVELAPGNNGIFDLTSANYQQQAAAAIADGIAGIRDHLAVQP